MAGVTKLPHVISRVLRRAPFVVYAKKAPDTLPFYDADKDFGYYFFSDLMESLYGLSPAFLTASDAPRNAKMDHPDDYEAYFKDDVGVCTRFHHPKVKRIVESWKMPAMHTTVLIRKTSMFFGQDQFMLGCFSPFDDLELGVTSFRAGRLQEELEEPAHVETEWFEAAFKHLPNATAIITADGDILAQNDLIMDYKHELPRVIDECLSHIYGTQSLDTNIDSWKFSNVSLESGKSRVWVWRSTPGSKDLAISIRPKHEFIQRQDAY
mmetsp:Transcript_1636/g.3102  ORF Transcript_1636/g.3102 Transcript_1636/m.3102 type:complete len:266 (+) Transcript_1636:84-881(+)